MSPRAAIGSLVLLSLAAIAPARAFQPDDERAPSAEALGGRVFTLESAEKAALLNDSGLLSTEQDRLIAEEKVKQAKSLFLPEVGMRGAAIKYNAQYPFATSAESGNVLLFPNGKGYGNTGTLFAGLGYMHMSLYEGGRTLNTLRLAQAALKQAVSRHNSLRMDVSFASKKSFYKLLLWREKLKAAKDYLGALGRLAAARALPPLDVLALQARMEEARETRARMEHQESLDRLGFLRALNLELDTPFDIRGDFYSAKAAFMNLHKALLWALELRPELQAQTYKAQMDAISVNLAQARRIPTIFLDGNYGVINQNAPVNEINWNATLGIKVPIAYDYLSQLQQKKAEQRQGDITRAKLQDTVKLDVRSAYAELLYWQKESPLRLKRLEALKRLYAALPAKAPVLRRAEILSSLMKLKLSALDSIYNRHIAAARLSRAIGKELE